ncbi:MAG: Hpt domain-containing protein [Oscillibacter sp.]|jgi:HPt (histidine-containing phosphotransfer) domain-containing protein|nr:Hpt domain-containing protein [Oscillibacter sp.]
MNHCKLTDAGINTQEGLTRFSGNEALYERFLRRFPADDNFARLCRAVEERDAAAAFTAAHTLKGITGNLSMNRLYGDLCPLVEALRRGELARAEELLGPVVRDYDAVAAVLAEEM